MYPDTLRYTKEHEWVRLEGDSATIGITDHAQQELGDIVFVDLPKPGTQVEQGKTMGTVESVKAVSEIYSPVTGQVAETNPILTDSPEKINEDPHGEAWLVKVRVTGPPPTELMTAAEYQSYIGEEK
jgi:glycine cleavage system H protein